MSMEGKQHSDVVAAIKAGGDETSLLVVDSETDNFFKSCKTSPTEKHLTGVLTGRGIEPMLPCFTLIVLNMLPNQIGLGFYFGAFFYIFI